MDMSVKRSTLNGNDGKTDMEGWLHKQGDRYKTWNKRWFVLRGPNLFYFKSPKVKYHFSRLFRCMFKWLLIAKL